MVEAIPCKCGTTPRERIGEGFPLVICGIPTHTTIGTYLYCPNCGKRTNAFREPYEAYNAWNKAANRETRNTSNP